MDMKRLILAAKTEGMRYSDMDVFNADNTNVDELRTYGYRIFFVATVDYVIDDFIGGTR